MVAKQNNEPLQIPTLEIMALKVTKQERSTQPMELESMDDQVSKWQDIPMELLVRILEFVGDRAVVMAAGVCTGWRVAIFDGVQKLSLSWCKRNMSNLIQSIAPKFSHLRSLNLRQNQIQQLNDNAVEAVVKYCHDLHCLDLSNSNRLTDASLETLAHGCNQLEKLSLSGCSGVSDSALIKLAMKCNKLIYLNLCGCVKAVTDRALQALGEYCHDLQSLNLGWCEKVTDVGVTSLAKGCPQLRAVDLCGCILITDQSVIALAENCRHLKYLGLYYCQNITDTAMYSLVNNCICGANSKQNTVDRFSYDAGVGRNSGKNDGNAVSCRDYMESVLNEQDGSGLVQLNIGQCTSLSAPVVQALCDTFPGLHTCPERHSLIISGCLNLTSVHCVCAVAARRGKKNRTAPTSVLHAIR